MTSPIYRLMKAGYTWRATRTCSPESSWAMPWESGLTRNLVSQSLFRALRAKRPARGLMHHSDRGSQYCSQEYRNLMERSGLRSSMSGKGNCFDNAPMESFWGTLKQELVHHRHYRSRQEAIRDITEYIEIFYNRQRRQARLGFLSPAAFQQRFYCRITRSLKGLVSHYCHPTPVEETGTLFSTIAANLNANAD